ncbi:chromosome partitioning protein ParB [Bifidobacterium hapali]|uniref:Chromosome partitioning protein ParB n=2 Tax=Bifidobacterium hapali TaxID=1630172 RepID=A0A261G402_9BIFI|nr:ParB/RepB/Spo0J family partition protein [Bifidobacterium hapali]OZG66144.1 chromosome partitioning protein ParB [Bifidobacterium hapali]
MAKSRLGKGLGALFPDLPGEPQEEHKSADAPAKTFATVPAVTVPAKDAATVAAIASAAASMGRNSAGDPLSASAKSATADESKNTHDAHGDGKSSKSKTKRASMPGLGEIAHPSDLFFGGEGLDQLSASVKGLGAVAHESASSAAVSSATTGGSATSNAASSSASAARSSSSTDVSRGTVTDTKSSSKSQSKKSDSSKNSDDEIELKPVQGGYLAELKITDIGPNAHQPRTIFDEDELNELAASIKEVGILQPIVVRKRPASQHVSHETSAAAGAAATDTPYELIMGERRWRASQLAGLTVIPAIVKTTADDDMLRDALLENLHRVALNPLEEAAAYQQMIDEFGLTQAQLSQSVSKSRPQIANTLRLLNLPASVQKKVAAGILSAGHARALLALNSEDEMDKLATRIIAEGLSVRSTEEIVAMMLAESDQPRKARVNKSNPWANSPIQQHLENRFDTKVSIKGSEKHGRIEIVFSSPEDMNRILDLLMPKDAGDDAAGPNAGWQ